MKPFNKQPFCEVCLDEPATSFSWIGKKWTFTGDCTRTTEDYYILFEQFFKSPEATVDWLAHMNEKQWMDWPDFMNMMDRFRAATNSFGVTV